MNIDLNEILSETGKVKQYLCDIEKSEFEMNNQKYQFVDDKYADITFSNKGNKEINVSMNLVATLEIPCDRCLQLVKVPFKFSVEKDIDLKKTAEERETELDECNFLQGMNFDTEVFIEEEMLVEMPMKVLCSDSCKGICKKCGTNLNNGSCDCDTAELDPRMSKVLDVFNQFKEV